MASLNKMFDLMTLLGNLSILIILLTIISPKVKHRTNLAFAANVVADHEQQSDGDDYTVIEFLKDLQHLHNYDNALLMHNKNSTIAAIFFAMDNSTNNTAADAASSNSNSNNNNITYIDQILGTQRSQSSSPPSMPFVAHLMEQVQVPVVQLNEWQHFYLKRQMADNLLAIVQIDINSGGIQSTLDQHTGLLQKLTQCLLHMKVAKVLFLINAPPEMMNDGTLEQAYEDVSKAVVEQLFHYCWRQKLLNVAALLADYRLTRIVYRFNPFPEFEMENVAIAKNRTEQEEIYPQRLANLLGFKMPIIIGGSDPRIIAYESNGKLIIDGFVGHFLSAFAKKYNCTIVEPLKFDPKTPIPSQDLIKAVRNGTVEWSAGVTFPQIPFVGYSYPYEIINWCLMIPIESDIPGYTFFTSVFKGETYVLVIGSLVVISMVLSAALFVHGHRPDILDIVCHDDCLRGMLGQSFTEMTNPPKIIRALYLEICVLGILLTTAYNAYFSTYVTKAPKTATLNTLDDIMASGLKSVAWQPEYNEIITRAPEFLKYSPMFVIEKSYQKYLQLRESFNTDYGYVVPTTKWTIVNEQQKIFTTPMFRHSSSFCFYNNIPMCFPINENSLFLESVYQLILETYQSGLINRWMEHGFMELIEAQKLEFLDLSQKKEFQAMKVDDLLYIFYFLAVMLVVVNLVFVGELLLFYHRRVFEKLRKCFCKRGHK